eukprot:3646821-Rhodomonas_salina.1
MLWLLSVLRSELSLPPSLRSRSECSCGAVAAVLSTWSVLFWRGSNRNFSTASLVPEMRLLVFAWVCVELCARTSARLMSALRG